MTTRAQALAAKVVNQLVGNAEAPSEIAAAAPPPEVAPVPAPEVKVMSHDEWANACQPLLPEGAQIEKDTCVYSLGGSMFAQACKKNDRGEMALEGSAMKVQSAVEPAVVPMPESPEEPEAKVANAEVADLKAQLEATNAKLAEANAQLAKADNDAKDAAFAASGIKADLAPIVKGSAARKEIKNQDGTAGVETWQQAVARIQVEMPSAFESKAPAQASAVTATEDAPRIEIGRQRHLPQGAAMGSRMIETAGASAIADNQDARRASANARKMPL